MKKNCLIPLWLGYLLSFGSFSVEAQICQQEKPLPTDQARFVLQSPHTVLDKQEKLEWQRCPVGLSGPACQQGKLQRFTLMQAWEFAARLRLDGSVEHQGWRLPTIDELATLKKVDCVDPAIDLALFPNVQGDWYWSSSHEPQSTLDYWYFDFKAGIAGQDDKNLANPVRLVRAANSNMK
ncbi:MAG: DUF1566 domain-containing protein [Aeromonadaceae bacterium]